VLVALVTITACGSSTSSSGPPKPLASGVRGIAVVDAGCPVITDAHPCPELPMKARVTVTKPGSKTIVGKADTDSKGRFTIALLPGMYEIKATNVTGVQVPWARTLPVTVAAHAFATVRIRFDSGVR
jgi:hypothetical protein